MPSAQADGRRSELERSAREGRGGDHDLLGMHAGLEGDVDRRHIPRPDGDALRGGTHPGYPDFQQVGTRTQIVETKATVGGDVDNHAEVGNAGGRQHETLAATDGDGPGQCARLIGQNINWKVEECDEDDQGEACRRRSTSPESRETRQKHGGVLSGELGHELAMGDLAAQGTRRPGGPVADASLARRGRSRCAGLSAWGDRGSWGSRGAVERAGRRRGCSEPGSPDERSRGSARVRAASAGSTADSTGSRVRSAPRRPGRPTPMTRPCGQTRCRAWRPAVSPLPRVRRTTPRPPWMRLR